MRPGGRPGGAYLARRLLLDTHRGTVYLGGTVEDAAAKRRAVELARQVQGVREVVDNLEIQPRR